MKLIIDIPEQVYLNAKADILCGADIIVSAIKDGIPHETVTEFADRCRECGREKVLDKIISEATSLKISYTDLDKDTYRRGINDVMKIIDKHISGKENK